MKILKALAILGLSLSASSSFADKLHLVKLFINAEPNASQYTGNICLTTNGLTKSCGNEAFIYKSLFNQWKIITSHMPVPVEIDQTCKPLFAYNSFPNTFASNTPIEIHIKLTDQKQLSIYNCNSGYSITGDM